MAGTARALNTPKSNPAEPLLPESMNTALPLEERIRQRAHEIYLQRGGEGGSEIDDWLQAEEEIRQSQGID